MKFFKTTFFALTLVCVNSVMAGEFSVRRKYQQQGVSGRSVEFTVLTQRGPCYLIEYVLSYGNEYFFKVQTNVCPNEEHNIFTGTGEFSVHFSNGEACSYPVSLSLIEAPQQGWYRDMNVPGQVQITKREGAACLPVPREQIYSQDPFFVAEE